MRILSAILPLLTLTLAFAPLKTAAQYDEKFYKPDTVWMENSLHNTTGFYIPVVQDSVYAIFSRPEGKPRALIFYCHGNTGNLSANHTVINSMTREGYAVFAFDYPGY